MPTQPRTMPGVLELLPREQVAFQSMLDAIRRGFELYGFVPVETPAIEFSDVLLTKTGGETERQVYFVQSTGALEQGEKPDLALRFDLTVPLARYVAEHEHELAFPFRRYQMQRVYRGERAQRGRFREFYQCDIDVIGKDTLSIRYDAEIPAVIHAVFRTLDFGSFTIRINNRKLLRGVLEALEIGDADEQTRVLREIDKTDKRGRDATYKALIDLGLESSKVATLLYVLYESSDKQQREQRANLCKQNIQRGEEPLLASTDPDLMLLDSLATLIPSVTWPDSLQEGMVELGEILRTIAALKVPRDCYCLDLSIARGLDYYTGTVYETTLNDHPEIGSICSGGRYDNLAGQYTKSKLPGVGISIGLTRLFWQLREAGLLKSARGTVNVLVTQMNEAQWPECLRISEELREANISTELSLEPGKLGKQLKYADRAGIRYALVLGEDELARSVVALKDLATGEQSEVPRTELIRTLVEKLRVP